MTDKFDQALNEMKTTLKPFIPDIAAPMRSSKLISHV